MNGRVAQQKNKFKLNHWKTVTAATLDLFFLARNFRLLRVRAEHNRAFGFPSLSKKIVRNINKDLKRAVKDNDEADAYLVKRFQDISMEGVSVCQ